MSKVRTRIERFDEAFKMLLIIMTITFSGSIAFYREIMEPRFFSYSAGIFVITVVLWTASTLCGGKGEYLGKIVAWYFLMDTFVTILARLHFTVFLLPPFVVTFIALAILSLTLPILWYLEDTIGEKYYKDLMEIFLVMTSFFIILDILYFLGIVTFPLG